MDGPVENYLKALEAAKQELVDVTATQEALERRKLVLRKSIETLSSLADLDGELSLVESKSLPEEIRIILKSGYPAPMMPNYVMGELRKMGRDLSSYRNPQAAIQTILKRMADDPDDPTEEMDSPDGKKAYLCPTDSSRLAGAFNVEPSAFPYRHLENLRKHYDEGGGSNKNTPPPPIAGTPIMPPPGRQNIPTSPIPPPPGYRARKMPPPWEKDKEKS